MGSALSFVCARVSMHLVSRSLARKQRRATRCKSRWAHKCIWFPRLSVMPPSQCARICSSRAMTCRFSTMPSKAMMLKTRSMMPQSLDAKLGSTRCNVMRVQNWQGAAFHQNTCDRSNSLERPPAFWYKAVPCSFCIHVMLHLFLPRQL